MGVSELKLLPQVWLHPVHSLQEHGSPDSGSPAQYSPCLPLSFKPLQQEGSTLECRKEALERVLQDIISNMVGGVDALDPPKQHSNRVSLSDTSLVIQYGGKELLHIPLLLTDVVKAVLPENQGSTYVVALAPRPEVACSVQERAQSPESKSPTPPKQGVWILVVAGDSLDLNRLFFDLGGLGALRWDLHECYKIVQRPLGEGCYGKVFLGQSLLAMHSNASEKRSEQTGQDVLGIHQVAVKLVKKCTTQAEEDMMRNEVGFLARAHGHPGITALYGVFCQHDHSKEGRESQAETAETARKHQVKWFIVMQLCSSGDLFDYISGNSFGNSETIALVKGVSSALDHLHTLRVIHRDVKTENILIDADLQPVLSDLGIAASLDDALEMTRVIGTPGYVAPEVVSNQPYDESADIFSAGVVYYYVLSGRLPFHGDNCYDTLSLTAACNVRYPRRWFSHASTALMELVKHCLSKHPSKRPSARQCLEGLSYHTLGDSTEYSGLRSRERGTMARVLMPAIQEVDRPAACELESSSARNSVQVMAGLEGAEVSSSAARSSIGELAEPGTVDATLVTALTNQDESQHQDLSASPRSEQNQLAPLPPSEGEAVQPSLPITLPVSLENNEEQPSVKSIEQKEQPEAMEQQKTPDTAAPVRPSSQSSLIAENNEEQPAVKSAEQKEPAEPTEQHEAADRTARNRASIVKRPLCSMPLKASRWIAGILQNSSRPAVEEQASSSSASGSQRPDAELTPKPPSSAMPPRRNFRRLAIARFRAQ